MTFEEYLSTNMGIVNEYLGCFYDGEADSDIRKYLYDPLAAFVRNAGKRHRPLICMLACSAVGGDPEKALRSGAAIELFHNAALVHDDIADDSTLRRGKPCMHLEMGMGLAINAGDMALSSMVPAVLSDDGLSEHVKLQVIGQLCEMDLRTIEGQALDVGWARDGRFDIELDDYLKMATLKTAYYSGGIPLAVGAIIGGGTPEQVEALRRFGMLTGLAFQIQDDLINLVGSEESAGKDFRSDITEGKRTFAAIHALRNSERSGELEQILDSKATDPELLERAVEIMVDAGSIDAARSYAEGLVREAKGLLAGAGLRPGELEILNDMADFFVKRLS